MFTQKNYPNLRPSLKSSNNYSIPDIDDDSKHKLFEKLATKLAKIIPTSRTVNVNTYSNNINLIPKQLTSSEKQIAAVMTMNTAFKLWYAPIIKLTDTEVESFSITLDKKLLDWACFKYYYIEKYDCFVMLEPVQENYCIKLIYFTNEKIFIQNFLFEGNAEGILDERSLFLSHIIYKESKTAELNLEKDKIPAMTLRKDISLNEIFAIILNAHTSKLKVDMFNYSGELSWKTTLFKLLMSMQPHKQKHICLDMTVELYSYVENNNTEQLVKYLCDNESVVQSMMGLSDDWSSKYIIDLNKKEYKTLDKIMENENENIKVELRKEPISYEFELSGYIDAKVSYVKMQDYTGFIGQMSVAGGNFAFITLPETNGFTKITLNIKELTDTEIKLLEYAPKISDILLASHLSFYSINYSQVEASTVEEKKLVNKVKDRKGKWKTVVKNEEDVVTKYIINLSKKRSMEYIRDHAVDGDGRVINYTTPSWMRAGHWRHYKNGKVIYISESECSRRKDLTDKKIKLKLGGAKIIEAT